MSETCPALAATPEAINNKFGNMTESEIAECKAKMRADLDARKGENPDANGEYNSASLTFLVSKYENGDTESIKNYISHIPNNNDYINAINMVVGMLALNEEEKDNFKADIAKRRAELGSE